MLQDTLEEDIDIFIDQTCNIMDDDPSSSYDETLQEKGTYDSFHHEWIKLLPESAQPPPNCYLFQNTKWEEFKDSLPLPRFSFEN